MTTVEIKTFAFSAGSKSLSIDNAVLGHVAKRLLFTIVKNAEFIGTMYTNPYKFLHYDISDFFSYFRTENISLTRAYLWA